MTDLIHHDHLPRRRIEEPRELNPRSFWDHLDRSPIYPEEVPALLVVLACLGLLVWTAVGG